jgi:hypothetical protein
MKTLVWIVAWLAVGIWSVIAWGAHVLIGFAGNTASSNADLIPVDPETVELVSWLAMLGTSLGEWIVIAIWAVVSLVLLGLGYVGARLVSKRSQRIIDEPRH